MRSYSLVLVFCVAFAFVAALPTNSVEEKEPRTDVDEGENYYGVDRDGRYVMRYRTPNGIIHFETGYQRVDDNGNLYQVKEGYYIYPTSDGRKVRVTYFADKDGYRVISSDIRDGEFEESEFEAQVNESME